MNRDLGTDRNEELIYGFGSPPGIDLDKHSDLPCFAASLSGLHVSFDNGRTWQSGYGSLELENPLPTSAVVVSPDFKTDRTIFAGIPGGVLRSIDGGRKWEQKAFPNPPPLISTLAISPDFLHDGIILAGTTEDGVFHSDDNGQHWKAWNFGLLDLNVYCMGISPDFGKDETVFLGVESGIFLSKNGGRAWKEVNLPVGFDPVLSLAVSPAFPEDRLVYAGTETKGLLFSTDRGKNWNKVESMYFSGSINSIVLDLDYPHKPHLLVLLEKSLLVSYDGGISWHRWREDRLSGLNVTSVFAPNGFDDSATVLVGTLEGSILRISGI
jgi:photosystem II stability/assembly factor-like uncharacterized protein